LTGLALLFFGFSFHDSIVSEFAISLKVKVVASPATARAQPSR
jgi:hypothetical protein